MTVRINPPGNNTASRISARRSPRAGGGSTPTPPSARRSPRAASAASLTIGIIQNRLFNSGVRDFSRVGRWRGFICAWFAQHTEAAAVARILGQAAAVRRDCGGGFFLTVRFHTGAQRWSD